MKLLKKSKKVYLMIFVILVALVFLVGLVIFYQKSSTDELTIILNSNDRDVRTKAYLHLIERVGPSEAQDELFRSGITYDGESHLLNHTVGEYLYQKFRFRGLDQCKEYFSASCYHGFLIEYISQNKASEIAKIIDYCRGRGMGVYYQCSHALGHGFLAYLGYDNLIGALQKCESTKKDIEIDLESCFGGVFMENIWGEHNGAINQTWVRSNDLNYPCDDERVDKKYLQSCWKEQPPLIYRQTNGDMKKIISVCESLTDQTLQYSCFWGIARLMNPLTGDNLLKKVSSCRELPEKWVGLCLGINASTSYGQGDRQIAFEICDYVVFGDDKGRCLRSLVNAIHSYRKDKSDEYSSCQKISDQKIRVSCLNEIK